ncbi:MAG: hypothetical protein K0B15_11105 [Lentimicrobium sp.]|nr:hypothetical protein [Lentimicrobium sp.]
MNKIFTLIILVCAMNIAAQETFVFDEGSVPDINSLNSRFFDHDGLWGYINGGADLYLEYGFEQITVLDVKANGLDYKADIYKMTSPEAAFGIFSISRYKCRDSGVLCENDCATPYQYIAAKGTYYLSVSNSTGSLEHQEIILKIAREILAQIPIEKVTVPSIFSHELLSDNSGSLKLITGPLGMQNGFVRWDRLFTGFTNYTVWILPVKQDDTNYTVSLVSFKNNEDEVSFLKKNELQLKNASILFPNRDGGFFLFEGNVPDNLLNMIQNGGY